MDSALLEGDLNSIRQRIILAARDAGRNPEDVKLIAVSKTISAGIILEALGCQQNVFGENYVQEAQTKIEYLGNLGHRPEFHLIGNLQRNKASLAVSLFSLIHTVDRLALAQEISKQAIRVGKTQEILVQVNVSEEESKSGVAPDQLKELLRQISPLEGISIKGLMCIGAYVDSSQPESIRCRDFLCLGKLRDRLEEELNIALPELSMGMSHDFELAIKHGATLVRVGSAIFGART